jgi:transcriptional regulator with XRE-family HTH domain
MSREDDRFQVTREVGARLRQLRLRARLTQAELADATGRGWPNTMVSKLEAGEYPNPGIAVLADYLRACRASFDDLSDVLNEYTSRPTPAEQQARRAVVKVVSQLPAEIGGQADSYDIKTTVARRFERKPPLSSEERVKRVVNLAAAASRSKRLDILVKYLEGEVGPGLVLTERQFLTRLARKFWGALTSTRGKPARLRVTRMARAVGYGVAEHVLSADKVRLVRDRVVDLFAMMETTGAFGAVPESKPYRRPTASDRSLRGLSPAQIARQAYIGEALSEAVAAVQTQDRSRGEAVTWYNWLTLLASAAYDTQPGTPEREKVLAEALRDRPDKERARKFADLALDGLDRFLHRK